MNGGEPRLPHERVQMIGAGAIGFSAWPSGMTSFEHRIHFSGHLNGDSHLGRGNSVGRSGWGKDATTAQSNPFASQARSSIFGAGHEARRPCRFRARVCFGRNWALRANARGGGDHIRIFLSDH